MPWGGQHPIEALKVRFSKGEVNVRYATYHPQGGWSKRSMNGEISGTTGRSRSLYGLLIMAERVEYRGRFEKSGWSVWQQSGAQVFSDQEAMVDVDVRTM